MVPPERVELSSPAPEAGTLSTELQGHYTTKNSMAEWGQQGWYRRAAVGDNHRRSPLSHIHVRTPGENLAHRESPRPSVAKGF